MKVEHRLQQVAHLLRGQLRNMMVETQINERTMRIILRIAAGAYWHSAIGTLNLDVLIPFLTVDRAAVNLKSNVVVLDLYIRNVCGIAEFHCRPKQCHLLLQLLPSGSNHAVLQTQSFHAYGKRCSRIHDLRLKVPDELQSRLLRHALLRS